jgi:membrane protease YdiL (CAAX protease family)
MRTSGSWIGVVWSLLDVARRRARARTRTQAKRNRAMSPTALYVVSLLGGLLLQIFLGYMFTQISGAADELGIEASGKILVSSYLQEQVAEYEQERSDYDAYVARLAQSQNKSDSAELSAAVNESVETNKAIARENLDESWKFVLEEFKFESRKMALHRGGSAAEWQDRLEQSYAARGISVFVPRVDSVEAYTPTAIGALAMLLGIAWLSWVLQGEGGGLDATRRRHPMWEWYLGFPISQSAVFTAEAIAPVASNPFLMASPALLAMVVGTHQQSYLAGICALPLAIPLTLAAAVWAKALEVQIMLRCSVRSRGGWFAVMAGIGLIAMLSPFVLAQSPGLTRQVLQLVSPLLTHLSGIRPLLEFSDLPSWLIAAGTSIAIGLLLALPAILVMRFAAARGLENGFGHIDAVISTTAFRRRESGRWAILSDPLLHKEWLWLKRDRGALVQLIGVPLFLAGFQYFNVRNMVGGVELTWNKLAAIVVGMGAYMLFIAGPRALLSEGQALGLTLSWPRSLEDTLRMKVRLVFAMVSSMVWLSLGFLIWMFPADAFKLLAVAIGWLLLGLCIAEKAVTLIGSPSHAGEPEPLPPSQIWAASLGNLTFAIALFTGQWPLAGAAIVLNWIFAGALWQGFRHRLPYLFDPASEPELRPPTILSSLVAIVALMELGIVFMVLFALVVGHDGAMFAQAMGYGAAAIVVSIYVLRWHRKRGVALAEILRFDDSSGLVPLGACMVAAAIGGGLGIVGIGYQHLLLSAPWPELREPLSKTIEFFALYPEMRIAYAIMAVGFAPWVEEFLFRGLMFRAMLPQWGLGASVLASSAFFTILHPAMAWPLVFSLGAINAYLFAKTRRLLPCVILHMIYNAVIVGLTGY